MTLEPTSKLTQKQHFETGIHIFINTQMKIKTQE